MTTHSSEAERDPSLLAYERLISDAHTLEDDRLVDLIVDRAPASSGLDLGLFLRAIPDLRRRPVVLDGAIEVCIKARADGSSTTVTAAGLKSAHPEFAQQIDTALRLDDEMMGTTELARWIADPVSLPLPAEVGPRIENGRRRYRLQELIGVGSQGSVYLGLDQSLSVPGHPTWVAVKRLHHSSSRDEAAKARRISHENVVRSLDAFVDDGGFVYNVFEHVPGVTLEAVRGKQSGTFDAQAAAELLLKIASGVQAAHAAGLVHRDLKPGNVLMLGNEPRITDFGIAHRLRIDRNQPGKGTLAFVSPQQFQGLAPSPLDDVYALGAILFWLLTGAYANGDTASDAGARLNTAISATHSEPFRLETLRPDLDSDIVSICHRALAFDPQARYQSADAMSSDLRAWLERRPLTWTQTTLRRRLTLSFLRHRLAWIAGISAACLLILAAAFAMHRVGDAEARRLAAELNALKLEHGVLRDRDVRARAVGTMFQNTLIQSRPDSTPANWIHAATFLETFGGAELFGDITKNQVLWDKRIDFAQLALANADKAGRRDSLEPLLIESCLVVWLVRAERGEEAIAHIDRITPIWRRLLDPDDPWLLELELYRAGAGYFVPKPDADNYKSLRRQRLAEAEAIAARIDPLPKALTLLMQHLRSLEAK